MSSSQPCRMLSSWIVTCVFLATLFNPRVQGAAVDPIRWIQYTGNDGAVWLNDDRRPALYTQVYGDCMGGSLINVTRFDAAYYKDNMTILFHLEGNSLITNQSLMMNIGVYAYGESRFNLLFDPCVANINSLCPINSSIPISANGIIPIAPSDVANIPSIAETIPDFEGMAILRIFSNTTESQIACFSAVVTNGYSFSHPSAVGSVLGAFAVLALVASLATSVYGQSIPDMRKHYAHSISVLVVFAVYHHIFFSGSLSANWPSVLVAFWSNYAWSAGIIHNQHMQNTINRFIGKDTGNITTIGSAPNGENASGLGGGYPTSLIYKRSEVGPLASYGDLLKRQASSANATNATAQYSWFGEPVLKGLPLPGNFSSFAGTLAELEIPASNAFMTAFLWFLILLLCVIGGMVLLKGVVEALAAFRLVKTTRLGIYRRHWLRYTGAAALRTCYIAFFMMVFFPMFQLTLGGSHGVKALAAVVLTIFLVAMLGISVMAVWYRRETPPMPEISEEASQQSQGSEMSEKSAWYKLSFKKSSPNHEPANTPPAGGRWSQKHMRNLHSGRVHPHDDETYTMKFGWLSARFRRSKWWFFCVWLIYELVRAAFYGGAAGHTMVQVFGLLVWEIIAFVVILIMRPFESNRLNLIIVYILGFSKVAIVALASAFDPRFGLGRIICTVIGVVIIVIQGILTLCLFVAILLGCISSYMSVKRYQESIRPRSLLRPRARYFEHIDHKATDRPRPPPPPPPPEPEHPKEPYFMVSHVRRERKIEEDDPGKDAESHVTELDVAPRASSSMELDKYVGVSRATSMLSRTSMSNLPYGARPHRASWSTRDFSNLNLDKGPGPHGRMSMESIRDTPSRHRAASLRLQTQAEAGMGVSGEMPNTSDPDISRRTHRRSASTLMGGQARGELSVAEEREIDMDHSYYGT